MGWQLVQEKIYFLEGRAERGSVLIKNVMEILRDMGFGRR